MDAPRHAGCWQACDLALMLIQVFHKIPFFAPLGALLVWFVVGLPWLWWAYAAAASILIVIAVPIGIELGQVRLPGKIPDTTDMALASLGGLPGYYLIKLIRARLATKPRHQAESAYHRARTGAKL